MKNEQISQENKFMAKIFGISVYGDSLKLFGFGLLCFLSGAFLLAAFPESILAVSFGIAFFFPGFLMFGFGIFRLIVPSRTDVNLLLGDDERSIRIREKAGYITLEIVLSGIFILAMINGLWSLNLKLNDIWVEAIIAIFIISYALRFYFKRKGDKI